MRNRAAFLSLAAALLCLGFDLYHFSHHLRHDPALLELEGVRVKMAWKIGLFLGTALLLIFSGRFLSLLIVMAFCLEPFALAAMTRESCERAKEFMKESGVARDAKENFFGRLKIKSPRTTFPPEMDKVTWWGTFKPFEFWESPELEATWINPRGETISRAPFRGGHCQLAKTTLPIDRLPQKRLEPGMWRVIVNCEDVVIDNHPFAVIGSSSPSPDAARGEDSAMMIWADGVNKE